MPDLSSRLNATRWPPASSTATVIGTRFISRAFFSATSTMVLAWARVTDMTPPWEIEVVMNKSTQHKGGQRPIAQSSVIQVGNPQGGTGALRSLLPESAFRAARLPRICAQSGLLHGLVFSSPCEETNFKAIDFAILITWPPVRNGRVARGVGRSNWRRRSGA